jgi:peptide deformylase
MAVRDIVVYPDDVLTTPTEEVGPEEDVSDLIQDLLDTMEAADGVGLAAPQIGVSKRVAVLRHEGETYILVNPRIHSYTKDSVKDTEGCLSFPGVSLEVPRHSKVNVKTEDENRDEKTIKAEGFFARALQHEIDHLDGTLFIDGLGEVRTRIFLRKYRKALRKVR